MSCLTSPTIHVQNDWFNKYVHGNFVYVTHPINPELSQTNCLLYLAAYNKLQVYARVFRCKTKTYSIPPYLSMTCTMTARERHNIAWTFWAIVVVFNTRKTVVFGTVEGFLRVYLWANCKTTQSGILKLSFFKWNRLNCTRWGRTIAKHPRTTHN